MIEHFYKMNAKIIIFVFLVICFTPTFFEARHNAAPETNAAKEISIATSKVSALKTAAAAKAELERNANIIKSTGRVDAEDLVEYLYDFVHKYKYISYADIARILLDYGDPKNKEQVKIFFQPFLGSELSTELTGAIDNYPYESISVNDALRLFNRPLERRMKIVIDKPNDN